MPLGGGGHTEKGHPAHYAGGAGRGQAGVGPHCGVSAPAGKRFGGGGKHRGRRRGRTGRAACRGPNGGDGSPQRGAATTMTKGPGDGERDPRWVTAIGPGRPAAIQRWPEGGEPGWAGRTNTGAVGAAGGGVLPEDWPIQPLARGGRTDGMWGRRNTGAKLGDGGGHGTEPVVTLLRKLGGQDEGELDGRRED